MIAWWWLLLVGPVCLFVGYVVGLLESRRIDRFFDDCFNKNTFTSPTDLTPPCAPFRAHDKTYEEWDDVVEQ